MSTSTVTARRRAPLIAALLLAAGVSVTLGVIGRAHGRSHHRLPAFGFSDIPTFKAWLASGVLLLAAAQLATALVMHRRLPGIRSTPRWAPAVHRITGAGAFTLSLPAAYYCLYSFGFAPAPLSTRTLLHSIAGCAFYGAFAAKVLLVHTHRLPRWALPIAGAALLTTVVLIWATSAPMGVPPHRDTHLSREDGPPNFGSTD